MTGFFSKIIKSLNGQRPVPYDRAKEMARDEDLRVRRELAGRQDLKPELLYFLAEDDAPEVRRAIAANVATPRQADLLLARDADQEVRVGLAEKIALLAPGLTADEQDKVRRMTYEALEILARDQVTRVRRILSEALKDVADAPPEVIFRLASDAELVVSGPILEFSPVLTNEDLIEIISSEPVSGALAAVSRRRDLGEIVSDAIVKCDDLDAIAQLLGNASAQIREETLDMLIDRAVDVDVWQEPLVRRPFLPQGAAGRLARFVAENLLDILTQRQDLDEDTAAEVRRVVRRRLAEEAGPQVPEEQLKKARDMQKAKTLDADAINDALQADRFDFVNAALVVLSGQPAPVVLKAVATRSAKGIVAIAWKAKLPGWIVEQLQLRLCRISRDDVLMPAAGQDYAISEEDMRWQLQFLSDLAKKG